MHVLHDERERTLAQIGFARLADRAGGRIGPERFVVGASIIVAGEPESARAPTESTAPEKTKARLATKRVSARTSCAANSPKISGE